jgi:hypothetical protein
MQPVAIKKCGKCRQTKPLDDFPSNARREDGHNKWCAACSERNATTKNAYYRRNPAPICQRQREYNSKNKDASANRMLLLKYGISLETYNEMLAKQNGCCAICGTDKPSLNPRFARFQVDHCHETGAIRGLLCHHCNNGLGCFKDDEALMLLAITYLKERKC